MMKGNKNEVFVYCFKNPFILSWVLFLVGDIFRYSCQGRKFW